MRQGGRQQRQKGKIVREEREIRIEGEKGGKLGGKKRGEGEKAAGRLQTKFRSDGEKGERGGKGRYSTSYLPLITLPSFPFLNLSPVVCHFL